MSRISDIARLLYVDPNRRAEFVKLMQEQGVVKDFESQIYRKDGSVIWISENARAVRDAEGKIEYYEGMVEDITARKEAEEKLRFSETALPLGLAEFQRRHAADRRTRASCWPSTAPSAKIVGLPADELVGRPFTVAYAGERETWRR